MTQRELAKRLHGRRIVRYDARAFRDGKGGWAYNPRITLDDGSRLIFVTQETEVGGYGVELCIIEPNEEFVRE